MYKVPFYWLKVKEQRCSTFSLNSNTFDFNCISGLQLTEVNHEARISALEENGGSGGSENGRIFSTL